MKKLLASILLGVGILCSACWIDPTDITSLNNAYISGVNNFIVHYTPASSISDVNYINGSSVALPLTVWIKANPVSSTGITQAVLQYKCKHDESWGSWVTVKSILNPTWSIAYGKDVALFGTYNIDPSGLVSGDLIMIRVYFTDGLKLTGNLDTDITSTVVTTTIPSTTYEGGWTPPFVFRVIYNGERRPK